MGTGMPGRSSIAFLGVVALLFAGALSQRVPARAPLSAAGPRVAELTDDQHSGGLRFAPDVHPVDQQVILATVARARPEARALIDRVDGAVTVRVASTGANVAGVTTSRPGGYDVVLALGAVSRQLGERGIARLVLHELGHVVDFALVPDDLARQLDEGVPRGYECDAGGGDGACAGPRERFAETFAKWATGDIGAALSIGYRIPPPASLEDWAEPLARLQAAG
ncbi:hypothetical protein BH20ACT18_BH20ACT18_06990 [soil metagenome]